MCDVSVRWLASVCGNFVILWSSSAPFLGHLHVIVAGVLVCNLLTYYSCFWLSFTSVWLLFLIIVSLICWGLHHEIIRGQAETLTYMYMCANEKLIIYLWVSPLSVLNYRNGAVHSLTSWCFSTFRSIKRSTRSLCECGISLTFLLLAILLHLSSAQQGEDDARLRVDAHSCHQHPARALHHMGTYTSRHMQTQVRCSKTS